MDGMEPYVPDELPLKEVDHSALIQLVGEANAALAEYNGLLQGMVGPGVLLSPLLNQEAVLSSRIEGTQATIEEVLEHEVGHTPQDESREQQDIKEILNYRKALMVAEEHVGEYGISLNLILEIHKILMDSVRGRTKMPGSFRKEQNWIGMHQCTIEEATFVPPNPFQLSNYLRDWETYIKSSDFDVVAQSGIIHAQFELLHPFKDGNGRLGRVLIPLFLFEKKRLLRPMFYISEYLEKNREEYYARLGNISQKGDWTGWLSFYLNAVKKQAHINNKKIRAIIKLYDETKEKIFKITHSRYASKLLDEFFIRPIFDVKGICQKINMPKPTAHNLIRQLKQNKLLWTLRKSAGNRGEILCFPELLSIVEERTAFAEFQGNKDKKD